MKPLMNQPTYNTNLCRKPRSGLTILEVMIAIGVATLGVFGAIAMIPIASQQSKLGLIEDHKSFFGQNAFHEFELHGMGHPDMWLYPNNSPVFNATANPDPPHVPPNTSYCIDPLYVAAGAGPNFFPSTGPVQMQRITLRSGPGLNGMNALLAEQVFVGNNDLVFHSTDDVLLPPEQEYARLDPTDPTSTPLKRQIQRAYSWMATVSPKFLGPNRGQTDFYTLSVIVYYNREMVGERVAEVAASADFYAGGIGGGDMVITGATPEDVAVKQRDWVMLSQRLNIGGTAVDIHKWYRVAAVDVDETDSELTRNITLQGPDIAPVASTQVTLAKGVVAVYEKTIRLESSSLWIP